MIESEPVFCYTVFMKAEQSHIPYWARRERESDFGWIGENIHVFWPAATAAYEEEGRGAILIDTTSRPTGEGNPFTYYLQEAIEAADDEDIKRLVREYDPEKAFVVVMLKTDARTSAYSVQIRSQSE